MQTAKEKCSDNYGHNIFDLVKVSVQVSFAARKTQFDIEYKTLHTSCLISCPTT